MQLKIKLSKYEYFILINNINNFKYDDTQIQLL